MYRPVQPVLLRGSYQHAVRAPSIDELVSIRSCPTSSLSRDRTLQRKQPARNGPTQGQRRGTVPRTGPAAGPAAYVRVRVAPGQRRTGGNPELEAEQADTSTFGVVLTSHLSAATAAPAGLARLVQHRPAGCDRAMGLLVGGQALLRFRLQPGLPWRAISIAASSRATRRPARFSRGSWTANIGGVDTSGVDLQVDWAVEPGPGRVGANLYLTHVRTWKYSDPSRRHHRVRGHDRWRRPGQGVARMEIAPERELPMERVQHICPLAATSTG